MSQITNVDGLFIAIAFIVPGFIFHNVRCQFIAGRQRTSQESVIGYLTYGSFNFAVFSWLIYLLAANAIASHWKAILWFVVIFLAPLVSGLIAGFATQRDWSHRFFRWAGLQPVHILPTAWDWKFGRSSEQWVLITLKDGTRFAGFLGAQSFISSDGGERDIYIEKIYNLDDDDNWVDVGEKSALVTHGEIRSIEFWPYRTKEPSNEQRQQEHDKAGQGRSREGLSADPDSAGRLLTKAAGRPPAGDGTGEAVSSSKPGL